mgnify:CR=1 FL=1
MSDPLSDFELAVLMSIALVFVSWSIYDLIVRYWDQD